MSQYRLILLFLFLLLPIGCTSLRSLEPDRAATAERLAASVTIVRDEWGVPHVLGASDASVAFGVAFAQAEDALWQIEDAYLHALGRASHWYGERFLASDLVSAAFEIERLSRDEYEREPPDRRAVWDAFAAGLNYFIRTSGARPRLITEYEPWMPFALARSIRAGTLIDGVRLGAVTDGDASRSAAIGQWAVLPSDTGTAGGGMQSDGPARVVDSSFMRAIAPSRSATGSAMLLHAATGPYFGTGQPYEMLLLSDAGWHVRGTAQPGLPVPWSGRNSRMAWGHARTAADNADIYEVTFDHPSDSLSYRFDNEWRLAVEWADTLLVNSPAGVVERVFRFRRTHHGPIVAHRDGHALAVRIARMEEGGSLQQLYATGRATGIEEFRVALDQRALAAAAMYADVTGNILLVPGNVVPVRDTAFDWSRPVDGGTSATAWRGLHTIAELPQILNPPSGWIHYTALNPKGVIDEREAGSHLTFEEVAAVAFDARVADAHDAIAQVILEWERVGGDDAARARRLDAPIELLREWDHTAHIESVAATLFVLWQELLQRGGFAGDLARFRALESVVAQLERDWGRADVEWGQINRIQRVAADGSEPFSDQRPSLPTAGAPGWLGSALAISARSEANTRMRYGIGGTRWVHAAELGQALRTETVVTFGQSADAGSPHWFDQALLFTAGRLKPAWFTRSEIMANARRTYRPSEAAVR